MLHTISKRSIKIIQTSFPVFARKPSPRPLPASIFFRDLEMKLIHDETISEFDERNSALDESKRSDAWLVGLTSRRDELVGDKSDHDETIWGVDETNSSATRRIGPIHDETIWEVDETNSVHDETNRNNDSTTRNANLVADLTSYSPNRDSEWDVWAILWAAAKHNKQNGRPKTRFGGKLIFFDRSFRYRPLFSV